MEGMEQSSPPFLSKEENMDIKKLSIDLETYSSVDLKRHGMYRYAEAEDFEILLFGVSVNDGPVEVYDLTRGDAIPEEILCALTDTKIPKWAYNAAFERVCLSSYLRRYNPYHFKSYGGVDDTTSKYLNPQGWRCSRIWGAYLGLPLSLEGIGAVLKLDEQKMQEGKNLIQFFCKPCRPTQTNGGRTRNLPYHASEKWKTFCAYNRRDVEVEMAIQKKLSHHPVPDFLWDEYVLDQTINDRGIEVDLEFVGEAMDFDARTRTILLDKLQKLTALDNPNSVAQMKAWLTENGLELETLGKKTVNALIPETEGNVKDALALRIQLAKSSIKKYEAMANTVCLDGRARGCFQFYGANRSGRWAGRHIQLQNLPQNHLDSLSDVRALVRSGDYELTARLYDNIPDVLSQLIRTAFVPKSGHRFIVSDFSAIEARVLAFLAGEEWRNEVFRSNGDIYCASASAMFKVTVEKHGVNSHLRQKGKIAELALGYGGGKGALVSMGALDMGLKEDELQDLVMTWRTANPNITSFWWGVDAAAKEAIVMKGKSGFMGIGFEYRGAILYIHLPSGRSLCYIKPKIGENKFGGESITYEGIDANHKWSRIETYGPKLVENIVQAISRDILAYAMKNLGNMKIVAHVHDELIIEAPQNITVEEVCKKMGATPPWLQGLCLRADGYETEFYRKD
jgi:DNA polymerase